MNREQERPLRLGDYGAFFATRARGAQLREDASRRIKDGSLWLDFTGVEAMTGAVADEFVCKLVLGGTFVTIANANESVYETVSRALARRKVEPFRAAFAGGYADEAAALPGTGIRTTE